MLWKCYVVTRLPNVKYFLMIRGDFISMNLASASANKDDGQFPVKLNLESSCGSCTYAIARLPIWQIDCRRRNSGNSALVLQH